VPGATLVALGFQTVFSSFFVSLLGMRRKWVLSLNFSRAGNCCCPASPKAGIVDFPAICSKPLQVEAKKRAEQNRGPTLFGLNWSRLRFISVASVLFDRERKPGRTRSSLTVERQAIPAGRSRISRPPAGVRGGQKTAAAKTSSRPGVQEKWPPKKDGHSCVEKLF